MAVNQVAYGFISMTDVFASRVTEVGVDVVNTAIEQSVAEHNRQMDALISFFCERTVKWKTRFRTPVLSRSQPLDDRGRARPIQVAGQYDIAFPIQASGSAWGATYVASQKMTVEEANLNTIAITEGDFRWLRDHILAALFANVSWAITDDEHGALTILGLANGDTQPYLVTSGSDAGATDTHYLGQAAAIATATNPFPAIKLELLEHPENGGEVVAFIPTANRAETEALASFVPVRDPNIQIGVNTSQLIGTLGTTVPGTVYGYADGVWLAEMKSLPANYVIAGTTQGARALGMREDPEVNLRGFNRVADRDDYPWYERQYLRRAGFGANNRVGALVHEIADASYDVPTTHVSPMA